jgi:hypothetical protein
MSASDLLSRAYGLQMSKIIMSNPIASTAEFSSVSIILFGLLLKKHEKKY